jgi:hypothetical protein
MLAAAERAAGGPRIPLAAIRVVLSENDDEPAVAWAMQRIRAALTAAALVQESPDADGLPSDM